MQHLSCDTEVFPFDWFVDFYDDENDIHHTFHNDNMAVYDFFKDNEFLTYGFNFKHYDKYIIDCILCNKSPETIKALNDDIIQYGIKGYESEHHRGAYSRIPFYDLFDDTQEGLSLKSFEAHLGLPIVECEVSFDVKHVLTKEECREVIKYLHKDTENTARLRKERMNYLNTKVSLGSRKGLSEEQALYMTNAQLTAEYLGAIGVSYNDERNYVFPDAIDYKYIPEPALAFFKRIQDPTISDYDLFYNPKSNFYEFYIGDCLVKIAWGGIHGAIEGYSEESTEDRDILNKDGDSFYPNIDRVYNYVSRAMADPSAYTKVIFERVEAKKSKDPKDKQKAVDLKLVVNTTYGCKGAKFSKLYDPLMMRSTCITGQLLLLWLSNMLYTECETVKIIQINTDGVMISVDKWERDKVEKLCAYFVERSKITLDTDRILKVVQKDVNNYIEVQTDGTVKKKGGYLVRGISPVGAFSINNQAPIIAEALEKYLVDGTSVTDTINNCDDIFKFQLICKASHKYKHSYHLVDDQLVEVQKCNRVYATDDKRYGQLYKAKSDSIAKVEKQCAGTQKLPEHCIIDNDNKLTIDNVYKQWYIDITLLKIMQFKKEKEKVIANTEKIFKEIREL